MAWQWRAKKEIAQGWKWMRQQDPDATADAERWAEENKEEMKDVDRILYRSDERYYGRSTSLDSEDAESMNAKGGYPDPEAFLPEDVRDRIYDDHAAVEAWIRTAVFVALPIITAAAIWRIVQLGQNATKRNLRRMFKRKRK